MNRVRLTRKNLFKSDDKAEKCIYSWVSVFFFKINLGILCSAYHRQYTELLKIHRVRPFRFDSIVENSAKMISLRSSNSVI